MGLPWVLMSLETDQKTSDYKSHDALKIHFKNWFIL